MENKSISTPTTPMEFTFTPENQRVKCLFFEKNISTELSSDYTLPDYLPELRKILGIRHKISPISRYIGNSIEFSGRMDYELIYCAENGELTSVPLGEDFSIEVTPEVPEWIDWASCGEAFAFFSADAVNARATAQRKVNVKCRLSATVKAYGYDEPCIGIANAKNAERLESEVNYTSFHHSMSEVIELSEEIPLTGGTEQYRYISSGGRAYVTDTNQNGNMLNCRGEVISDTIAENKETGEILHFSTKLPFTHGVELPSEINENATHSVLCYCNEMRVSDGGDKYLLDTDVILEIDSLKNNKTMLTHDIFVPRHASDVYYRDFKYETLFKSGCEKLTLSENIGLKDADDDQNEIIDCITSLKLDPIKQNGESTAICGNLKAKIIYRTRGEYASHEAIVPFSADIGIIPSEEKRAVSVYPSIRDVRCRAKDKNASLEADIALSYVVMKNESVRIADSIKVGDKTKNVQYGITVYYPEKNETLWNVAKKFGISLSSLAEANGLNVQNAKEPLSGKHFLVIS